MSAQPEENPWEGRPENAICARKTLMSTLRTHPAQHTRSSIKQHAIFSRACGARRGARKNLRARARTLEHFCGDCG